MPTATQAWPSAQSTSFLDGALNRKRRVETSAGLRAGCQVPKVIKFFTREQLTEEVDLRLRAYDDEIRKAVGDGYSWPIRMRDWELWETMDAFERHEGPKQLVLDTGSYNTYLPLWLARRSGRTIASDLLGRRRRTNILRRVGLLPTKTTEAPYGEWSKLMGNGAPNLDLRSIDLTRIPFADGTVDCITSVSVIEHIPDPGTALKEMFRCLRPGGLLLLTTDCAPDPVPYAKGSRRFSGDELLALMRPYGDLNGCAQPSFERRNWCYGRNEPIVTAFIRILKPLTR